MLILPSTLSKVPMTSTEEQSFFNFLSSCTAEDILRLLIQDLPLPHVSCSSPCSFVIESELQSLNDPNVYYFDILAIERLQIICPLAAEPETTEGESEGEEKDRAVRTVDIFWEKIDSSPGNIKWPTKTYSASVEYINRMKPNSIRIKTSDPKLLALLGSATRFA